MNKGSRYHRRKEAAVRYNKELRKRRKRKLVEMLGGACSRCGYKKCISALEFHHTDPSSKLMNINESTIGRSWEKVCDEVKKCIVLCANCHREEHAAPEDMEGWPKGKAAPC